MSMLAPRRKEEYISAIHSRTQVEVKDLKGFSVERLKDIWTVIKPKRMQVLPSNWKKGDLESLRELYMPRCWFRPTSSRTTITGDRAPRELCGRVEGGVPRVPSPRGGVQRDTALPAVSSAHDGANQPTHGGGLLRLQALPDMQANIASDLRSTSDCTGSERARQHQGGACQGKDGSSGGSGPRGAIQERTEATRGPLERLGRILENGWSSACGMRLLRHRAREEVQHQPDSGRDGHGGELEAAEGRQNAPLRGDPGAREEDAPAKPGRHQGLNQPDETPSGHEKLSSDQVRGLIAEGKRRRAHLKKGLARRLLGNVKSMAYGVMLTSIAMLGAGMQSIPAENMNRPDCLEIFAGTATVSYQFSRWGWRSAEPVDLLYGTDLRVEENRTWILSWIREHRPRHVIVSYPCHLWSPLSNLNFSTPQAKRRLAKLRQKDLPFLELCEEIFNIQIANDDDALGENPLTSASFTTEPIQRTLRHPQVYTAVSHGCRFGVMHPSSGKPMKKLTLWFSTSPEICDELSKRCSNSGAEHDHEHDRCLGAKTTRSAQHYTKQIAQAICRGFLQTLKRKEPSRVRSMLRQLSVSLRKALRDKKVHAEREVKWSEKTVNRAMKAWNVVFAVGSQSSAAASAPIGVPCEDDLAAGPQEPGRLAAGAPMQMEPPPLRTGLESDGIMFEIPPGRRLESSVQQALKRVHCNLGHPSKADMERFLKLGGAKQEVLEALSWMKCISCAHAQRPATHRAANIPPCQLVFGDEHDAGKEGHWFLSILDRATSYHIAELLSDHSPQALYRAFDRGWSRWAGPPAQVTVDFEGGFQGKQFWEQVSSAGTLLTSIAGTAHWQAGKVERHNQIIKDMITTTIRHTQARGREQVRSLAREVSWAKNSLTREHGWSPVALVFGREPRVFGELVEQGNATGYHPQVGDSGSEVAMRMRYRYHAKLEYTRSQARHMLAKTVQQRTRRVTVPQVGQLVFFWRKEKSKDRPSQSKWVGPGYVVGTQKSNAWVACGGRCFLVAGEHLREAIGDEKHFGNPEIQKAMALFKKIPAEATFEDLVGQEGPTEDPMEVEESPLAEDIGDELIEPEASDLGLPPELTHVSRSEGWHDDGYGNPVLVTRKAWAYRTTEPKFEGIRYPYGSSWGYVNGQWKCLEREVVWTSLEDPHAVIKEGPVAMLLTVFRSRTRKDVCREDVPVSMKKRREQQVHAVETAGPRSKTKLRRMMEKEIPYDKIDPQRPRCLPGCGRERMG